MSSQPDDAERTRLNRIDLWVDLITDPERDEEITPLVPLVMALANEARKLPMPPPTATVILFKEGGKYYTEEQWRIPEDAIGPYDMERSSDRRHIGRGPVLVVTQEPWGYPHLINYVEGIGD